ncbi:DUF433 domain-containing protein [Mariniradius sediminis]|uniref:DUF433 domain-containing protein n=1 Tax=Mariniradius sediminis TaxID=2909237 RepID=A0ABS9BXL8_9BACT|nr:DUF433 domain-containing protein [Mariniradius sediminis]MCF1752202.1 DUF433 domain-containing protein [Mariniradius sediminis]
MDYKELIERNPSVLGGKPIIKGTRISVELIIRKLGDGYSISEILDNYPHLTTDQVKAALQYAADVIAFEETITDTIPRSV